MIMKQAYLKQVPDEPKVKQAHDDEVEECDQDFTKKARIKKIRKPTVRRKWVEKNSFDWGEPQQKAFEKMKQAIAGNAMAGADPELQYHLATDANDAALGGCLFQLHDTPPDTEATPKLLSNERINLFMSFKLQDAETRYSNSERECFAIVKCLAEIRWMIMRSKYSIMIYIDHEALKPIFVIDQTEKGRIVT